MSSSFNLGATKPNNGLILLAFDLWFEWFVLVLESYCYCKNSGQISCMYSRCLIDGMKDENQHWKIWIKLNSKSLEKGLKIGGTCDNSLILA